MWGYSLMVNNIVRSKYIYVENNKIEILFSNNIFGLTFQSPSYYWYLFGYWYLLVLVFNLSIGIYFLGWYLFEILLISSTVKNSKTVLKSGCF